MDRARLTGFVDGVRESAQSAAQLGRTSLLGVTFIFVLLGVAAGGRQVSAPTLALALVGALAFHLAVYAANDIVDLPIDRTEPRRATSPLVRGNVTTRQMTVTVGVACLAALLAALALAAFAALAAMAASLALLLVYDVWGKRCPVPPLTDLAQGLGWAALVVFGSAAAGGARPATAWLALYVTVSILLVNGVHGAVRDLANDARHGARTTAMWLGGSTDAGGAAHLPARLWAYGIVLHILDVGVLVAALATADAGRGPELAIVVLGGLGCLVVLCAGLAHVDRPRASWGAGFAYIIAMLVLPATLVVDHLRGSVLIAIVVLFAVPWAASSFVRTTMIGGVRQRRRAAAE